MTNLLDVANGSLHKCHCQDLKNENEREFQNQNINMMFEKMEKSTRSQMEEVA